jgi:hypothetical protein
MMTFKGQEESGTSFSIQKPSVVVEFLTFLLRIGEVPGSNPVPKNGYID